MDPNTLNIIKGAAGAAGGEGLYVEEVFNTDLYDSNNTTGPVINNGIDLATEGGLVWAKNRNQVGNSYSLSDSGRGKNTTYYYLGSDLQDGQGGGGAGGISSFNSNGYTLSATASRGNQSTAGAENVSWTFRKAPGFFDVVTWSGNGDDTRTISHSLGCKPGMIVYKATNNVTDWWVWHKNLGANKYLRLNSDVAEGTDNNASVEAYKFGQYTPTDSDFKVGEWDGNTNTVNYVAYLFADGDESGAQIFGKGGNESIIKCGLFSGTGFTNLGWEPQLILIKPHTQSWGWEAYDNMRGMGLPGAASAGPGLYPNTNSKEIGGSSISFEAQGFTQGTFGASYPCVYIAIRRGPMKTPEDATKVFDDVVYNGTGGAHDVPISPSYADLVFYKRRNAADNWGWTSRLTGNLAHLTSNGAGAAPGSNAEANRAADDALEYDVQSAFGLVGNSSGEVNYSGESYISYSFKRAPGFFDVVCYNSTNGSTQTISHNLGVAPELMIFKSRGVVNNWWIYHNDLGASKAIKLDGNAGAVTSATWLNNTAPTSSVFTLGSGGYANWNTTTYIAYLFASCPGICKIGTYTSDGEPQNIDCGFSAGARFILIKRHDNNSDWYVFDAARGINSGNDPYVMLNRNDVETTNADCIDPYNPGFTVAGSGDSNALINYTGENFIYLAIA